MTTPKETQSGRSTKPKKDFPAVTKTGGKAWEELQDEEEWEDIAIDMDEETNYPEFGADMRALLSQYDPHSVTAAIKGTHNAREPLSAPENKTVRWLNKIEDGENAQETYNDLAARLAKNVDIPDGNSEEGQRRALVRRKQLFMIFRQMLRDLRNLDIQHRARNGDKSEGPSIGFQELSRKLDAATSHPVDMSKKVDEEPTAGNEDTKNPTADLAEAGSNLLSGQGLEEPPTAQFLKDKGEDTTVLDEEDEDELAMDEAGQEDEEDVPEEDVPEDAPAEDLPNEDLPTEGLPTEGLPAEGLPAEGLPTEDVPPPQLSAEEIMNQLKQQLKEEKEREDKKKELQELFGVIEALQNQVNEMKQSRGLPIRSSGLLKNASTVKRPRF
jgi:hypothetical protein